MENLLAKGWVMPVVLVVFILLMVVYYLFRSKTAKKQEEDRQQKLDSLVPGVKVLTIDYTYGTIVSSTKTDVVIETGDEEHKGYIRLDKRGIYRIITDEEIAEQNATEQEGESAQQPFENFEVQEKTEEQVEEQPEEQPEEKAEEQAETEE